MNSVPPDPFEFADRIGAELVDLLRFRSHAEFGHVETQEQFSATLSASLLCVAGVLRAHVTRGAQPARLAEICAQQLEAILQHAEGQGRVSR